MEGKSQFEQAPQKNPYLEMRDKAREAASELQRKVVETQGALYEMNLYRLMERGGDNTELVNALRGFLGAIEHQSIFADITKPLSQDRISQLTKFFKEKTEELRPSQERGW